MSLEDSNFLLDSFGTPSNSMNLQDTNTSSDQIFLYMNDNSNDQQQQQQTTQTHDQQQQPQQQPITTNEHQMDIKEEYHMDQTNDHHIDDQQQQQQQQQQAQQQQSPESQAVDESALENNKQQEQQEQPQQPQYHHHTVYIKGEQYQDYNSILTPDSHNFYPLSNNNVINNNVNNNNIQSPQQQQQQQIQSPHQHQVHSPPQIIPVAPPAPPPPPPPSTLTPMYVLSTSSPAISTQIIQQQKNLRPITERGQEDKKKEALDFLNFYFRVVPTKKVATVKRSIVLALYTNKISVDKRYKQPNDMANLCGAVYTFIFQHLDDNTILEYITSAENERLSASRTDVKKRKRKKTHDVSNGQEVNHHDAFLTCIKYASLLPFIEFVGIGELGSVYSDYMGTHPEWQYTTEELSKWEIELRDQKSNHTGKRLPAIIDQNYRNHYNCSSNNSSNSNNNSNSNSGSNSMNNSSNGLGIINNSANGLSAFGSTSSTASLITTSPSLGETVLEKYTGLLGFNSSFSNNSGTNSSSTTTTTTTSTNNNNGSNSNNCNISQLPSPLSIGNGTNGNSSSSNSNSSFSNTFYSLCPTGGTSSNGTTNIPVNVSETNENFIIYAFIPFYKPNALKITVNQMDIILEGMISLPETIQIPNGTEIIVPHSTNFTSTMNEIQEGSFYKVIKLSSPIASSTVGKRDGVVVIIAKKEEGQTTIHQL